MSLDSHLQSILQQYATYRVPPLESLSPHAARACYQLPDAIDDLVAHRLATRALTLLAPHPEPVPSVRHHVLQTPAGDLMLRLYSPKGGGPHPALIYFHGGGFVIGTLNAYDASCRALCNAADCLVISIGYRQAPEHPFPAAVNDAYAAVRFVQTQGELLGADKSRIVLAGESAGGNLAAVTCLQLRDKGEPLPLRQLLIYPLVDWQGGTDSYAQYAEAHPLSAAMMGWFRKHYLPNAADYANPLASPLHADLAGVPPATIIAAEVDPLRSEGQAYAHKLAAAKVDADYRLYAGTTHEFFGMAALVTPAKEALKDAAGDLREAFGRTSSFG